MPTLDPDHFPLVLTRDEGGLFNVMCPILPGCVGQGKTRDLALANVRQAIELFLQSRERAAGPAVEGALDPLQPIFDLSTLELFAQTEFVVSHGPLDRLPGFMRKGPMESVDRLCRHYVGELNAARGSAGDGVQVRVTDVHAAALLKLGLTVYFTDMKRALPESSGWLRSLEAQLGLPECTVLGAFANSPGSGLALHHDRYDQLLFQIRGEKVFRYAPNGFVDRPNQQFSPFDAAATEFGQCYRNGFPQSAEELLRANAQTVTLKPGSAFFMPSGTWHTTAEQTEEALSMVVVVRAPLRQDLLLNMLRYYVGQSPEWRAPCYSGWSSDEALRARERETLATLIADLGRRLPKLNVSDAYGAWIVEGYSTGSQSDYPLTSRFESYIRLPNSSVEFQTEPAADTLRFIVKSGSIRQPQTQVALSFDANARPVVEWVLGTRAAFTFEQACKTFPDLTRDHLSTLFAWLSKAALVRPLPVAEWAT